MTVAKFRGGAESLSRASFTYLPALDGMRAVAILLVVLSHFGLNVVLPGGFGVTLFFFISGFLITRLLIAEVNGNGEVAIGAFYVRRFIRLGPALLVNIGLVTVLYLLLGEPTSKWEVLAGLFYVMNYYYVLGGAMPLPLGTLWSLAVEEHYYAVYPWLFALGWRRPLRFLAGLAIASVAVLALRVLFAALWPDTIWQHYYRTDTRIDSILYGAMFACLLELVRFDRFIRAIGGTAGFVAGIVLLLFTFVYRDPVFRETVRYSVQGVALIPVLYAVLFNPRFAPLRRLLELPPMVLLGRLSYSLYLWHEVVLSVMPKVLPGTLWSLYLVQLPLCFVIAAASYYGVERPFLTLRKAFRRERPAPPPQAVTTAA